MENQWNLLEFIGNYLEFIAIYWKSMNSHGGPPFSQSMRSRKLPGQTELSAIRSPRSENGGSSGVLWKYMVVRDVVDIKILRNGPGSSPE